MNNDLIERRKWFWGWDDEQEEAWLSGMARQGLHLVKPAPFGRYAFRQGEAQEVVYRLDFLPGKDKREDYQQLFIDAGWEHVGEMSGWQYWRKAVAPGEQPEIFTDPDSKILKYQRLLGLLLLFFLPLLAGMINLHLYLSTASSGEALRWSDGLMLALQGLQGLLFILYGYVIVRIAVRIRQLKRR